MSTTIDQRVVEMQFDNKHFERNVSDTMSTLDKLKQKLNLSGASKGLENVDTAAKRIDMSGLANGIETVRTRFSALEVMGVTALANITNSAVNAGKRIVSALTVEPIKTGLSEYETQINAVQTILANTESKGTTLKDVNGALDELNTYADKTIYNFTEMTRNIGTFTAAGVDLDTSVNAIQGIANLAAVSGSNSQQASTAMYQLSQAMASGTVKLMDWNSVVNAGMGGQVFQDALKETARVHGVKIDDMIKKQGSFRETLQEGWLTTDILTETLSKFTMATEGLSQAEIEANKEKLKTLGYTDEQIEGIFKLGNTATNAATKVKTFTQLWDTLKETAQSGWTQTWEILLGDFEEAKEFFSNLYNTLAPMLDGMSKARNELLQGWKDEGGRKDIIASLYNVFQGIGNIVKPIKEAFRDIFPPMTVKQLVSFTEGLKNLTFSFKKFFEEGSDNAKNLKTTFKGLFAILDIVKMSFGAVFDLISPLFGEIGTMGSGALGLTASWADWVLNLRDSIKEGNIFGKVVDKIQGAFKKVKEFIVPVIDGIKEFGSSVAEAFYGLSVKVETRLEPLAAFGNFIKSIFVGAGKVIQKVLPYVSAAATGIGNVLSDLMKAISDGIQNANWDSFFDFTNGGIISAIGIFIAKFIKSGGDILDGAGGFLENINGILEGVGDALNAFTESLKAEALKKIATAIAILAGSLLVLALIPSDRLNSAIIAITALFGELMGSMYAFGKMGDMKGLAKTVSSLIGMSYALLILAIATKIMSTMSLEEMGVGLISMVVGIGALANAIKMLPETKVAGAAKAMKKMSVAVLILAIAIKIMSTMSMEEMAIGLTSMVVGISALVYAVKMLPTDVTTKTAGVIGLAFAMVILGGALKIMATLSWDDIARSLVALAGGLGALVGAMALMKNLKSGAVAILLVTPALLTLAGTMKILGTMTWDDIARGLVTLAGALGILTAAMYLMQKAIIGAFAIKIIAPTLLSLAVSMKVLGSMSWDEICRGLVVLAGAFAVIGLAGLLLGPITPMIIVLSKAIMLLGIACAAIGAGALMLGAGLTMISVAGSAAAVSLVTIVSSIISLIPYLIEQIGVGIIKLCEVISGSGAAIFEAAKVLIVAFVDALVTSVPALVDGALVLITSLLQSLTQYAPQIVNGLFDFVISIINSLADRIPDFIQAGVNLIMSIFAGIVDVLKSVDPQVLINGLLSIGVITAMMGALAIIAALTPGAMVGVLGLGAVITELGLVLAAIGALAQIPGLTWLVEEGGQFMASIGGAIGGFIGSLIGGIAQGITSALPQIGMDLSTFMVALQPFILGAKQIDASTMDGVNALVGVILALTAASLLDSLTSWLTGGSSLADFAAQLIPFGQAMVAFSSTVAGNIDEAAVVAAANAGKIMADMASSLPNSGGVFGFFTGENDMDVFGAQLVAFGACITAFSATVAGRVDETAVTSAANAGKTMAEMAKTLPNSGGVVGFFTGENDMDVFGAQLVAFGACITAFSATVAGRVDETAVTSASNAGKTMAEMAKTLPNSGGVVGFFTGENNMDTFGAQLVSFGKSIASFCTTVAGKIDESAVTAAANAGRTMAELADTLPNSGGMKSWFVGDNDMATFGEQLRAFGSAMVGFSNEVSSVNSSSLTMAVDQATKLINMAKGAAGVDFGGLSDFGDSLGNIGALSVQNFVNAFHNSAADVADAGRTLVLNTLKGVDNAKTDFKNAGVNLVLELGTGISKAKGRVKAFATTMIADTLSAIREKYTSFKNAGKYLVEGFGKGIDENTWMAEAEARAMANAAEKAAKDALKVNSPSKVFIPLGKAIPEGLAKGMNMMGSVVSHSSEDMAHVALSSTRGVLANIADAVNSDIDTQPTIRPVLDLSDISSGAGAIGGLFGDQLVGVSANAGSISAAMNLRQNGVNNDVISAIKDLGRKMGTSTGNTYMINGLSYSEGDDVSEALKTIVGAVRREGRS